MDQLTQLYKSRAEDLQEQINRLEHKLKYLNLQEAPQVTITTHPDGSRTYTDQQGHSRTVPAGGAPAAAGGLPGGGGCQKENVPELALSGVCGATDQITNFLGDYAPWVKLIGGIGLGAWTGNKLASFAKSGVDVVNAIPLANAARRKANADASASESTATVIAVEAQHAPAYYEGQARQAAGRGAEAEAIGIEAPERAEAERLRQQSLADEARQRAAQTGAQEQAITAQEQAKARSEQAKAAKGQIGAKDVADKAKVTALENELDLARARARLQKPGQIPSGPYRNQPGYQDPDTGWWFTKSPDSPRAARELTQTSLENLGAGKMPRGTRVTSSGAIALEPQHPLQDLLSKAAEGIELTGKDVKAAGDALRRGATTPLPG